MGSPLLTLSPGCFSQLTILPSVMVELSAGMKTSLTAAVVVEVGFACLRERPGRAAPRLTPADLLSSMLDAIVTHAQTRYTCNYASQDPNKR